MESVISGDDQRTLKVIQPQGYSFHWAQLSEEAGHVREEPGKRQRAAEDKGSFQCWEDRVKRAGPWGLPGFHLHKPGLMVVLCRFSYCILIGCW